MNPGGRHGGAEGSLRSGLLGLGFVGALGTMLELVLARHWSTPIRLLPWFVLAIIAVLALRPTRGAIRLARAVAVASVAMGMFGVVEHVKANDDAARLDAVFGPKWDAMSGASRWWRALIESVGPSPPFAPAALGAHRGVSAARDDAPSGDQVRREAYGRAPDRRAVALVASARCPRARH